MFNAYSMLDHVLKQLCRQWPEEDTWVGINEFGVEIGHFRHPHFRNVFSLHRQMIQAEKQFKKAANEGTRLFQDPGVLTAQAVTLSSILMYRFLLQSMSSDQMTFLQPGGQFFSYLSLLFSSLFFYPFFLAILDGRMCAWSLPTNIRLTEMEMSPSGSFTTVDGLRPPCQQTFSPILSSKTLCMWRCVRTWKTIQYRKSEIPGRKGKRSQYFLILDLHMLGSFGIFYK